MDVSVSLGLYLADKNKGVFKDTFLTFSDKPALMTLKGNVVQKAAQMVKKGATTVDEKTAQDEEAAKKRPRSDSIDGVGVAGDSNVNPGSSMALPRLYRQPLPVLKSPFVQHLWRH
jgi:hypothetical protein